MRGAGGGVEVVDIDDAPGRGELLTMRAVSICGSDFGYIAGGSRFVMGHELAGVREDGVAVAVEAMYGCMTCDYCRDGAYNLCARQSEDALGFAADGGMAEQFSRAEQPPRSVAAGPRRAVTGRWSNPRRSRGRRAPRRNRARHAVSWWREGAPLARWRSRPHAAQGADDVGLDARYDHQREIGERLGASAVTGLYDMVVEAAGSASSLARSVELVAPGGSVVVLGVHVPDFSPDFLSLFLKEARIIPSLGYCRHAGGHDMTQAAAMLASDPEIVAAGLVTHRFPLEDAPEAFRVAQDRQSGALKVVIEVP